MIVLPLSVAAILGLLPEALVLDPLRWHFHELMFGYIAAAVAGFLLTAIPNWTGRLPLQGGPLLGLVCLWGAGRLAMLAAGTLGPLAAAALDSLFLAVLAGLVARELVAGHNRRNLPMLAILAAFLGANIMFHAVSLGLLPDDGFDRRSAVACIAFLVALIGGRVTPSFTRNWLVKHEAAELPASFGPLDRATLLATLIALAVWVIAPEGPACAAAAALAAALTLLRLLRWQGHRVLGEPLLWVLHLGTLWLAAGLALLAASALVGAIPSVTAIHALTAGAMGTMTMAVMSRAILGHGGHELRAGPGLSWAFVLVSLAAAARISASLADDLYLSLITLSVAAWIAAFALFLLVCGPKLLTARARPADDS
jgi:uncharacterized protein involved in response to NO